MRGRAVGPAGHAVQARRVHPTGGAAGPRAWGGSGRLRSPEGAAASVLVAPAPTVNLAVLTPNLVSSALPPPSLPPQLLRPVLWPTQAAPARGPHAVPGAAAAARGGRAAADGVGPLWIAQPLGHGWVPGCRLCSEGFGERSSVGGRAASDGGGARRAAEPLGHYRGVFSAATWREALGCCPGCACHQAAGCRTAPCRSHDASATLLPM